MNDPDQDRRHMAAALELAARGEGAVEPNPMVGCVIARGPTVVGRGWHARFGGPHAEPTALAEAGDRAAGATMYVTLEPCCHRGKTPPCSEAVIRAGVGRVVIGLADPFPQVDGGGIARLRQAGIDVEVGLMQQRVRRLCAPYLKLVGTGRPWVLAKWAMTLDGKLATGQGDSRWISCPASREIVHRIRGRVDAVVVGRRTAESDDPLLTARPAGPRLATRIVLDTMAALSSDSRLIQTIDQAPLLVAAGAEPPQANVDRLTTAGCEVFRCDGADHAQRWGALLDELGHRRMTNVLVEGGAQVLGTLLDARSIDEVHAFIAPKLIGGVDASSPISGVGAALMADAVTLDDIDVQRIDSDIYLRGIVG